MSEQTNGIKNENPNEPASGIIKLSHARTWRTYRGGKLLESFLGVDNPRDSHFPELWIASTVAARNAGREEIPDEGLTYVLEEDQPSETTTDSPTSPHSATSPTSLKALLHAEPVKYLGAKHVEKFGSTPGVLIKIIDSSERLSIQVHPDKAQAKALFDSDFGKTECWHILGGREINGEKPHIYFGFKEGITKERWREVFDSQDIPAMLDLLHRFDVEPGETYLIEGGVPHAIGAGCYLVEIQEPTDLTIRTERFSASGEPIADMMCHQGIGFDKMFACFSYEGLSREETKRRWCIQPKESVQLEESHQADEPSQLEESVKLEPSFQVEQSFQSKESPRPTIPIQVGKDAQGFFNKKTLVGYEDMPCFRMDEWRVKGTQCVETGGLFSVLVVLEGEGVLRDGQREMRLAPADLLFIPAQVASFEISANRESGVRFFSCFGPA